MNKLRPLRRRDTRRQRSALPPTVDAKKAAQVKESEYSEQNAKRRVADEQQRINGNLPPPEDDKPHLDFNPEHMPNITKWKRSEQPREPWNEQVGMSVLSPPETHTDALKSLSLLLATNRQQEYVELLLPPVDQPRHTEKQWLVVVFGGANNSRPLMLRFFT